MSDMENIQTPKTNICQITKSNIPFYLLSSVVTILVGVLWHYIYDFLGKAHIIGWISPVNESVFEHLKLCFWPILVVWLIMEAAGILIDDIDISKGIVCAAASSIISIALTLGIHYVFYEGFAIHAMALDITAYIVSILVGQLVAVIHIFPFKLCNCVKILGYVVVIGLAICLALLTYHVPSAPIFME